MATKSSTGAFADWREGALLALMFVPLIAMMLLIPPIGQDEKYHAFADTRTFFGIPNFANVISNAGFLIVGVLGLALCAGRRIDGASRSWLVFFAGALLVAAGSAYYHWYPTTQTLVWDRLPMTLAFMALFTGLVSEHVRPHLEVRLLWASLAVGVASIVWWRYSNDLRFYGWVQFAPLVVIVFLLLAYPGRFSHRPYLIYGLIAYALAKVAEMTDHGIFNATAHAISGHTLKHLLAAVAPLCVYLMLRSRKPLRG